MWHPSNKQRRIRARRKDIGYGWMMMMMMMMMMWHIICDIIHRLCRIISDGWQQSCIIKYIFCTHWTSGSFSTLGNLIAGGVLGPSHIDSYTTYFLFTLFVLENHRYEGCTHFNNYGGTTQPSHSYMNNNMPHSVLPTPQDPHSVLATAPERTMTSLNLIRAKPVQESSGSSCSTEQPNNPVQPANNNPGAPLAQPANNNPAAAPGTGPANNNPAAPLVQPANNNPPLVQPANNNPAAAPGTGPAYFQQQAPPWAYLLCWDKRMGGVVIVKQPQAYTTTKTACVVYGGQNNTWVHQQYG